MHSNTAHGAPNSKLNLGSISDGCDMFCKAKTINTWVYTQKRQKKAVSLYDNIFHIFQETTENPLEDYNS